MPKIRGHDQRYVRIPNKPIARATLVRGKFVLVVCVGRSGLVVAM